LNAANEVAVAAFLAGRIAFPEIAERVAEALDAHLLESRGATAADVECVLEADRRARAHVERQLGPRSPRPLQEALSA
jgi:1-deoxy-D-xylulose-5-phosphate reductoisomerase